MAGSKGSKQVQITGLPPADAVRLLVRMGYRDMTVEKLQEDIDAGAPVNADGTLNVIHYGAWMLKEAGRGD